MAELQFTAQQLIVNDTFPKSSFFENIVDKNQLQYERNGYYYKFEVEYNKNKNYFWIYSKFGNPLPYSSDVLDIQKNITIDNPRNPGQAELRNQLFALYDFDSYNFYISNNMKKGLVF